MNIDGFWALIEECREDGVKCEEVAEALLLRLKNMPVETILEFQSELDERMVETYRWDLWAVAYIVGGGCSDDGFDYFRGWLIAQGREFYETALMDAELAANGMDPGEVYECEDMLYVPAQAYEEVKGEAMPARKLNLPQKGPVGKPWEEEDLPNLYPELYDKFS
jgi:hypothetical protein